MSVKKAIGERRVIVAGVIPSDNVDELVAVRRSLVDEFDPVFIGATEDELRECAVAYPGAEFLVIPWTPHRLVTEEIIDLLPELKVIISTYGGVKRNVAVERALDGGVRLTCTGAVRARSVAEFTLGLMIDRLLYISRTHHDMRNGEEFPRYGYTRELTERTVGIVGFGSITRELIDLLQPFRNDLLVYSRHANADEIARLNARAASMSEVLERSDLVVLLTGLTDDTYHLIDAAALARMKPGAVLINTARGKLVDETALIDALTEGRVSAALDVYEEEPLAPDSPLRRLENVTITAHSANSTREMDLGRWEFALRELRGYTESQLLTGELTRERIDSMSDD